jgi:predicted dehydrogenase
MPEPAQKDKGVTEPTALMRAYAYTAPPPGRPVRLALVGAGIFVRDAHLPALAQLRGYFELAAVWSRSEESVQAVVQQWRELGGGHLAVYTDLAALLADQEIEAVDVVLPIPQQAEVVAQALAGGKHVVSEKPIAQSSETALALIETHRRHPERVWMVAENWRYEEAFVRAAELLRAGAIGRPLVAHWSQFSPMTPQSKYYGTAWRRGGEFRGGLLLDSGVHYISVLRMLLGEVRSVSAHVQQVAPDLNPADTLTATLEFAGGVQATYLNTFAVASPFSAPLTIVGDSGGLRVERGRIELVQNGVAGVQEMHCAKFNGVHDELAAFAGAVADGVPQRNTPLEGLADLEVIEAMLTSAEEGVRQTVG